MKLSGEHQLVSALTYRVENGSEVQIERLGIEVLAVVMMNFESNCNESTISLLPHLIGVNII